MICTVVSRSQLPYARVLAAALRRLDPAARLTVLVMDGARNDPDAGFDALGLRDVLADPDPALYALPEAELRRRARAALLRYGIERGEDVVLVEPELDPHAPLDDLLSRASTHGVALVPRLLAPIPDDGERPTYAEIARGGIFDSGVLAVGANAAGRAFAEWWQGAEASREPGEPSPLDLAPTLFPDALIVRDPGHGVAYWNLPGRPLEPGALRSFYFADFDPRRPHWLSENNTRVRVTESKPLTALCDSYAARLLEAGWEAARDEPWGHARLANGVPVDATLRSLLTNARADGLELGDPFSEEGTALLMEWATGPAPVGAASGVTRYMLELHRSREDLGGAFPLLDNEDGVDYVRWVVEHGADEVGIHEALLPARELPGADGARVPFAVNVAGYLGGALGLGEAARGYVRALQSVGVPVRTESVDPPLPTGQRSFGVPAVRKRLKYAELDASHDAPLNLVCVNAPELPGFAQRVGEEFFDGRKTVGVWGWETSFIPPEWDEAFGLLDEVWTYSTYVASVLAQRAPVPVVAVPLPVSAPNEIADRLELELGDAFTFLFAFDFISTIQRKNPLGLVEAFKRAFRPGEGPQLVVKSFNGDYKPEHHERLRHAVRDRDDILLFDEFVSVEQRNALMARADCYVSLHRSEGFGLTMAEAMALGKPVIATGYSGNLDFMDPGCAYLVDYTLTEVGPGVEIYPAEGIWAEPDLDHAAAQMRHVYEHPDEVAQRAERGRMRIAEQLSPEACGAIARGRLERLAVSLATENVAQPAPNTLDALARKAAVDLRHPGAGALPSQLGRRVVVGATRPLVRHQSEVNQLTVDALSELQQLHANLEPRVAKLEKQRLRRRAALADARNQRLEEQVAELERRLDALESNGQP